MPFQLIKLSLTNTEVGMVVMVKSQFCTLTVVRLISCTMPSALRAGIDIQSPGLSISLTDTWMEATSPKMVSWNTSISTAAMAPMPRIRLIGFLFVSKATITITPKKINMIFSSCK